MVAHGMLFEVVEWLDQGLLECPPIHHTITPTILSLVAEIAGEGTPESFTLSF